ncbi:MAG: hypothetical protein K2L99_05945, partial [Muribaculaceae bacterium]|nr:hypothetical protein [Muribaculaceae bacterium]
IIDEKRELIGFQPAMTTDAITVAMVYSRLDNLGSGDFVPDFSTRFPGVVRVCDAVTAAMQQAGSSTLLRDLAIE